MDCFESGPSSHAAPRLSLIAILEAYHVTSSLSNGRIPVESQSTWGMSRNRQTDRRRCSSMLPCMLTQYSPVLMQAARSSAEEDYWKIRRRSLSLSSQPVLGDRTNNWTVPCFYGTLNDTFFWLLGLVPDFWLVPAQGRLTALARIPANFRLAV